MNKKQITIRYDIRKTPLIFILAGVLLTTILINLLIFLVFNNFNVICLIVPIGLLGYTIYFSDVLLLEYQILKWYEKSIFIRDKQQDSQILKNQIIIIEKSKEQVKISFKKMGYFTESQIDSFALLLNDFVYNFEFAEIEPDSKYYHIIYKPQRTRINLEKVNFSDLIFPDKSGYKIDSELESPFCHTLVVGATSSGKSYLIQNYYYPLLSQVGDIHIIDIKNTTPKEWRVNYTKDIKGGLKTLKNAQIEMDRRYDLELLDEKPLFVVFEEVQAFKAALEKDELKEYEKCLRTILVKGRECKVFIFFISQFANTGSGGVFTSTGERSQFYTTVNCGVPSQEQSMQVFNRPKSELPPRLSNEKGSGYIKIDNDVYFIELPTKNKTEVKENDKTRIWKREH